MPPLSPARIILSLLPAVVLVVTAASSVFGEGGLLVHAQLRERRDALNAEIVELSNLNACLLREISLLDQEPVARRRLAADVFGRAEPGATLYTFRDDASGSAPPNCAPIAPHTRHTEALDSPH